MEGVTLVELIYERDISPFNAMQLIWGHKTWRQWIVCVRHSPKIFSGTELQVIFVYGILGNV